MMWLPEVGEPTIWDTVELQGVLGSEHDANLPHWIAFFFQALKHLVGWNVLSE